MKADFEASEFYQTVSIHSFIHSFTHKSFHSIFSSLFSCHHRGCEIVNSVLKIISMAKKIAK
ncbi:hypothetical protein DERF_016716 [Dermatophagoides farinae]|uniref:Uncharacterized protein n=1 Tax=Dermatophagoides farinae TaxID=6954 RepID=A0A922KY20_DERFA|nr:hypothetical protein DERF_016716 [Dermatophagoides farinae]